MPWRLHRDVRSACGSAQALAVYAVLLLGPPLTIQAATLTTSGTASWYGEAERGKLMANGKPFNPDTLTAASWFYPLGTRLQVSLRTTRVSRTVTVIVTDRGPALRLVREGRIIDLSHTAFARLANPERGLIQVRIHRLAEEPEDDLTFSAAKGPNIAPLKHPGTGTSLTEQSSAVTSSKLPWNFWSKIELPKDKIFCLNDGRDSLYEATPAGSGSPLCNRRTDR